MKVITSEKLPIKSWCETPEAGCIEQAKNLANLPFAFKHIALMPDTHQGYGMPIGGVLAARGVIIPNAVGVDIGCGMCAIKTSLRPEELSKDLLKEIMGDIRKAVPVGFSHRPRPCDDSEIPAVPYTFSSIVAKEFSSAKKQLGTLGGGNHFIEIQKSRNNDPLGLEEHVWIMIHSGSRNLGKKVCDHYNKIAKELNAKWFSSVPVKHDLAHLPYDSQEGYAYFEEMKYCLEFSKANRRKMLVDIKAAFEAHVKVQFETAIDIQHNYAAWENHFGENVIIHRKGATSARAGQVGIIPGSQGTASYIVEGLGNPESFMSCSHGAGRRMGRKEAVRSLDFEAETKKMEDKGIIHSLRTKDDLDEAASAYKDIDTVMAEQADLVKIVTRLKPMAVVKG